VAGIDASRSVPSCECAAANGARFAGGAGTGGGWDQTQEPHAEGGCHEHDDVPPRRRAGSARRRARRRHDPRRGAPALPRGARRANLGVGDRLHPGEPGRRPAGLGLRHAAVRPAEPAAGAAAGRHRRGRHGAEKPARLRVDGALVARRRLERSGTSPCCCAFWSRPCSRTAPACGPPWWRPSGESDRCGSSSLERRRRDLSQRLSHLRHPTGTASFDVPCCERHRAPIQVHGKLSSDARCPRARPANGRFARPHRHRAYGSWVSPSP
jgi:hypothetical protein